MDKDLYKVVTGALLHDIGKFAERAGMKLEPLYEANNEGLYCPESKGKASHRHALYTAAFIEKYKDILPYMFNSREWLSEDSPEDSFINLAAKHHKADTPMQWIIATADRLSSAMDRAEFEEYNKGIGVRDYKKTRMFSIFESLDADISSERADDYLYRYMLKELSPVNIFPIDDEKYRTVESKEANEEYKSLFEGFVKNLKNLKHKEYLPLWLEHFDSLLMVYASHIPAATVGRVVPDVSLYDHLRTTAAFAAALYLYHRHTDSMDTKAILEEREDKFLIVSGDFYGIQEFIFASGGSSSKFAAKLLRGRSFMVSLMTELAANIICNKLRLPFSSIIFNAAGKFTLIAPNTQKAVKMAEAAVEDINSWLKKHFYGESAIGITLTKASAEDFKEENFPTLWKCVGENVEAQKYKRLNMERWCGVVSHYLEDFPEGTGPCQFCGKRPAKEVYREDSDKYYLCSICKDTIYIGKNIVKSENMVVTTVDVNIHGDSTIEPIFGRYIITFNRRGELSELAEKGYLIKYCDISMPDEPLLFKGLTIRFINGYVPAYDDEAGRSGAIVSKTFEDIAKASLLEDNGKLKGIEAIGVLKADVDELGRVFESRLRRKSISRLATLSRQMNNFFSIYLPYVMNQNERFQNIYTVFSGGDDMFFIGPWNHIIEFAHFVYDEFKRYTCGKLALSAGITIHKAHEPIKHYAEEAEAALDASKSGGRDSITIFNKTVKWDAFKVLEEIKGEILEWHKTGIINNAMLYRWNELIEMVQKDYKVRKSLAGSGMITGKIDYSVLGWRALLRYSTARNVAKEIKDNEKRKQIIEHVSQKVCEWLGDYRDEFVIPLWQIMYSLRANRNKEKEE